MRTLLPGLRFDVNTCIVRSQCLCEDSRGHDLRRPSPQTRLPGHVKVSIRDLWNSHLFMGCYKTMKSIYLEINIPTPNSNIRFSKGANAKCQPNRHIRNEAAHTHSPKDLVSIFPIDHYFFSFTFHGIRFESLIHIYSGSGTNNATILHKFIRLKSWLVNETRK